jgi:predicted RNase H-like nuclease (RuvC/YqgF family)
MISLIIFGFIVISIFILAGYFAFRILTEKAKQNAEKEFARKNWQLNDMQANLKSQCVEFEKRKNKELNDIIHKQETALAVYREAYKNLLASEKIRHTSEIKTEALQKRIDQLQSELYQARKRAERLANKTKNAVQITPLMD